MNTAVTSIDGLIEKIVALNVAEGGLVESRELADFNYSTGKLTFDEWVELDDPMSAALVELRIAREKLQDEVDELIALEFVTGDATWELKEAPLVS